MTFGPFGPFGLLFWLVAWNSRPPPRNRANVVGPRYVLEVPNEPVGPRVAISLTFSIESTAAFLQVLSKTQPPELDVSCVLAFTLGLVAAVILLPPQRWVTFDDREIRAYVPWRRQPRIVRYRDIVAIRKSLLLNRYVLRTSARQALRLHGRSHGFATLARLLLQHLPESTHMSLRTRKALEETARLDAFEGPV